MSKKGIVKRYIVTPDKHAPYQDKKAISVVKQSIELIKPDGYIDLGDLGEWASVSHWQWKRKKKPPLEYLMPRVEADIKAVNQLLDEIDESLDKANVKIRHICVGNHDEWLEGIVAEHPYLKSFGFREACKFDERGYIYHPCGEYFKVGKLYYYHGHHFGGQYHTANLMDGPKSAWSIGCLKDMSAEKNAWLGGRQHKWVHGFAIVDYYKDGQFTVHPIQIINGCASVWGEEIRG